MARMVGIGRICSEQQDSHCNQDFAFHGKLWKRIENGGQYKKEGKSRESDGICEKNEEGV